jgi:hypothetical protein
MKILKTTLSYPLHILCSVFILIIPLFFATVTAQTYTLPATHSDNTLTSATAVNTINCDLIDECPGISQYGVIAWDDNSGSGVRAYFDVLYNGTSIMGPIALPAGSEKPDVVIGTKNNILLGTYQVGIFYQLGTDVYIDHWKVDITQTPPNQITHISGAPWKLNTNAAGSPHIDQHTDQFNPLPICASGYPDIIQDSIAIPATNWYMATWHEYNSTAGVYEVHSFYGNLTSAPTSLPSTNFKIIASPGKFPDVAASWQYYPSGWSGGPGWIPKAYFTYTTDNTTLGQDLWITEYNMPALSLTTTSLETGKDIYAPRIEAQGMMDVSLGSFFHLWKVAAAVGPAGDGGTIDGKIYYPGGSNQIYPSYGSDIRVPVLAAGSGFMSPVGGRSTFNTYYPFAFYAPYGSHYHMGAAVYNNLLLSGVWELNSSSISLSSPDPYAVGLAATNNSGMNLLAAWFDGSNIQYKISEPSNLNSTMWKPTSIENIEKDNEDVYPNPAREKLTITGISKTTAYSISDITGRPISSGQLTKANNTIETADLPQGVYIISFMHDGKTQQRKFVKQ